MREEAERAKDAVCHCGACWPDSLSPYSESFRGNMQTYYIHKIEHKCVCYTSQYFYSEMVVCVVMQTLVMCA